MKSCCLKLYRAYSVSFNLSNVDKFLWSWILKDGIKVQEEEKENCCFVFPSSKKSEITHFHVVVVKRRLRNVQKKCYGRAKLLFCRSRCRFCRRCLSSLLGTVTSNDVDGSENVEKKIGFILSKTTTLHVHHAFCTFLCPFLHDYDAFYGLRKQASTKFYFFSWTWMWSQGILWTT